MDSRSSPGRAPRRGGSSPGRAPRRDKSPRRGGSPRRDRSPRRSGSPRRGGSSPGRAPRRSWAADDDWFRPESPVSDAERPPARARRREPKDGDASDAERAPARARRREPKDGDASDASDASDADGSDAAASVGESLSEQGKLVVALESAARYVADTLRPSCAPYVRFAIACRTQHYARSGPTPFATLSACHRFVLDNERDLPTARNQRAILTRDAVARKLSVARAAVYPYALAVVADMKRVPPPEETPRVERQIFGGNVAPVEDHWLPTACKLTAEDFRACLSEHEAEALRETCVSLGLQRDPVERPEAQHVSLRLLRCGCHEVLPVLNASIGNILSGVTPPETIHLRSASREVAAGSALSPRSRRRALCDSVLGYD